MLAILATLTGSGVAADTASPVTLQAQATTLQQRWTQMVHAGVDPTELAPLRRELAQAESVSLFGLPLAFFRPDSRLQLNGWLAETDAVWDKSIHEARAGATEAEQGLHALRPGEAASARQERLDALAAASTPAEFKALRDEWNLEVLLVPLDADLAAKVGVLSKLADQARALGIRSDPAQALLGAAAKYASLSERDRLAQAGGLIATFQSVVTDLTARISAGQRAKQVFAQAASEISTASFYGLDISSYQARVNADSSKFAAATTVAELDAVTNDLNGAVAGLKQALAAWLSQTHVIAGVAFYYQTHALSCEEAAVSMALTHQGIYVSQDTILKEMGADLRPMYRDSSGRVRWGNPYVSFVGSVDGSMAKYTGYQANYPPLVDVAIAHHARILAYGYMTAETIYARVAAGHPVVAWATWDWAWHPRHDYLSFDGVWIPWIGPTYSSHVYTVVGVKPDAVLVNDPYRGQYWVSKTTFAAAYSDFMEAIVFA